MFTERSHFTDDTILTIATAHALMTDFDLETMYSDYGQKYPSSYGLMFQNWIDEVVTGPYNGFATGWSVRSDDTVLAQVRKYRSQHINLLWLMVSIIHGCA